MSKIHTKYDKLGDAKAISETIQPPPHTEWQGQLLEDAISSKKCAWLWNPFPLPYWYIPSEKIGQNFWPPRNGFFGIN